MIGLIQFFPLFLLKAALAKRLARQALNFGQNFEVGHPIDQKNIADKSKANY